MSPMSMLSQEMDAYRWFPGAKTLTKDNVAVPRPAEDEVKVLAAGMCHSDLIYYDEAFDHGRTKPFTMGHEGAGEIIALGKTVPSSFPELHLGQYVVIHSQNPCLVSTCSKCSIDADNLCSEHMSLGLGLDGSYAPYVAVPARDIVPVNATKEEIPPPVAAVSTDAVLTCYHTLRDLKAGETVLIIGIGGLGVNAIQIAKNVKGAKTVIASDKRDVALQAAIEVGADYAVKPEDLSSFISSHKLVIDTACDFVGLGSTFSSALEHVRPRGTVLIIGLSAPSVSLSIVLATVKEVTIKGNYWGTKAELAEVMEIVKARKVMPVVETRPLSQAEVAFEEMRNTKLTGRVAFVPEHK